ncbi:MAG: AAA family ATPase [bacterium]|nr:AAA family ATPase [bacterium]
MRIAFFGACGTGKTTLVTSMDKELNLKPLYNNARNIISGLGIQDVTEIEPTKRALMLESILISRIMKQIDLLDDDFISDRSPLDELMYWELDNDVNFPSLTPVIKKFVYTYLNKFKYDLLVCVPVEFDLSEKEKKEDRLRYVDEHRLLEDAYVKNFFEMEKKELKTCKKIIQVNGSVQDRILLIKQALKELDLLPPITSDNEKFVKQIIKK